jgi:hypothetical protein
MASWNTDPPEFREINNGKKFTSADSLTAEDINYIIENLQYLYLHGGTEVDLERIYPIGSYFITESTTTPASMFGGTWVKVKDRFLLGDGDTYTANSEGGSSTVTLTTDQMPYHTHQEMLSNGSWNYNAVYNQGGAVSTYEGAAISGLSVSAKGGYAYVGYSGNNQPHNNMPPYRVVKIWRRTA